MSEVAPFDLVRQELGLSYRDFSATLGVPFSSVYNACRGLSVIPRKAQEALKELGFAPEELVARQREWLEERAVARRQAILEKRLGAA